MRWFFLTCILLATSSDVLSKPRPKRDLSYLKNLIASKLFGADTIVIQEPEIPKNETYQLFKVKGYDNILLKVTRKPEKKENVKVVIKNVQDPVMVSPEIAVIGKYLGTRTQSETLLALEIAKNLVRSGILSSKFHETEQEMAIPMAPLQTYNDYIPEEHAKPVQLLVDGRDPVFVYSSIANEPVINNPVKHNPLAYYPGNYPPMLITSELKYQPVKTRYSYKQKGDNADMTYESYNNQDVVVTRTNKEPPIPQYIKLRFAELASIAANPYLIRSQQPVEVMTEEQLVQPINKIRSFNDYRNPPVMVNQNMQEVSPYAMDHYSIPIKSVPNLEVAEEVGYVVPNSINHPPVLIDRNQLPKPQPKPTDLKNSKIPLDIRNHLLDTEINKMNEIYEKHNISHNLKNIVPPKKMPSISQKQSQKYVLKLDKETDKKENQMASDIFDAQNNDTTKGIVSKYLYKQMNHNSRDKYTVVKVGNPPEFPKLADSSKTNSAVKTVDVVPDDFVYVPPENIVPPMIDITKTNNIKNSTDKINYPRGFHTSQTKNNSLELVPFTGTGSLKTNDEHSLKHDPIVVLEDKPQENENTVMTGGQKESTFKYTGGPIF